MSELAAPFAMALPSLLQHLRVRGRGTGHVAQPRTRPHREPPAGRPGRPAPVARRTTNPSRTPSRPARHPPDPYHREGNLT
ncbi:MAG: hypothetical protein ABI692_00750 [Terracoccus sp.]